jgi:hypothetical protein
MNKKRNKPELVIGKLRAAEAARANLLNFSGTQRS